MYNSKVIKNFTKPTNAGGMKGSSAVGKFTSEDNCDVVKIYIKVDEDTGIITEASFKTFGSPATIACSNVACDLLHDLSIEDAKELSNADIIKELGELPMDKISSATSVENAIKNAIEAYEKKQNN